jgi:NADH-ubiquinone oxidoreductase chain 4
MFILLLLLIIIPFFGIIYITTNTNNENYTAKKIGLNASILNLIISLILFIMYDYSNIDFQFVQEIKEIKGINLYIGIDGISIYFVLLTTIIMPLVILSNWYSISENEKLYVIIILSLEILLLLVFLTLNIFSYYIFFESTLIPLFLLIGIYGSSNKIRASFYLFIYTLSGSLFLLIAILYILTELGGTDLDLLFKSNLNYYIQLALFFGIFIAFAVKTPVIFLNTWLLKAHVESPLGGSVILAAIVLKLSLYGIFRLILPIIPKASINCTYIVYVIGIITILYASISTLRTIDIKELIAYSSVSHAAVYLLASFSNVIQGLEGSILLGLGHGFVSSGLFICVGGILYDRSHSRLISIYKGLAQVIPMFSIMFFILCLSNAGTPLSINFIGEFLSLYGAFERLPLLAIFAASSVVLSAAYTIYMFNRTTFGGNYSKLFIVNIRDLTKREFLILTILIVFTIVLGIYPAPIIDGLNYSVSTLLYYS